MYTVDQKITHDKVKAQPGTTFIIVKFDRDGKSYTGSRQIYTHLLVNGKEVKQTEEDISKMAEYLYEQTLAKNGLAPE